MSDQLIAVVNDDTLFLDLMNRLLVEEGYRTLLITEGSRAYGVLREERPDLIVLDVRLEHPEGGWKVLELIRLDPETADIPVIICSADSRFLREKGELLREKRCDVLEKPFELDDLLRLGGERIGPPLAKPSGGT